MTWQEEQFTRNVWAACIKQAMADMEDKEYVRDYMNNNHRENRKTAIQFLKSPVFDWICQELDFPARQIRQEAFK